MNIKIYDKRGNHNYKEKKLLKKLKEVIESKAKQDSNFLNEFTPAKDYTELNNLFNKYCVEEAEYIDVTNDTQTNTTPQNMETPETTDDFSLSEDSVFIDPLNREEPKVRSYVMDEEFPSSQPKAETETRTSFAEPSSFSESFDLPSDDDNEPAKKTSTDKGSGGKKSPTSTPINPDFESMDNSRKRKNSKKFAKYIVEAVCMLAEKGFVWYATKDINEPKLAEYELNNEMDLDLLVNLSDGQEATVKQFFKIQCANAELLSKFDEQKKLDLSDALADVMIEKGVTPTPTQELMLVGLTILGEKAIALMTITSQNNSLLAQLREMNVGNQRPQTRQQAPPPPPPPQQTKSSAVEDIQFTEVEREVVKQKVNEMIENIEKEEGSYETLGNVVEKPIETKE
jgi:hypothetical protein